MLLPNKDEMIDGMVAGGCRCRLSTSWISRSSLLNLWYRYSRPPLAPVVDPSHCLTPRPLLVATACYLATPIPSSLLLSGPGQSYGIVYLLSSTFLSSRPTLV